MAYLVHGEGKEREEDAAAVQADALGAYGEHLVLIFLLLLVRFHLVRRPAYGKRACRMKTRAKQESNEVAHVAIADACAYPGTVVIVHLDADATVSAVERSRWSQHLARLAYLHIVVFHRFINYLLAVIIVIGVLDRRQLELVDIVELGCR